jgi:hypothetical protein
VYLVRALHYVIPPPFVPFRRLQIPNNQKEKQVDKNQEQTGEES